MTVASHNGPRRSRAKAQAEIASVQPDLFQRLEEPHPQPADLDLGPELLGAINTAIRQARGQGLSRERIVDRMNALLPDLPKPVTVRQLNAWTAVSKEYHEFPARLLPAFCVATDCDLPMRTLAGGMGCELFDAREATARRLGETLIESARLKREQRELSRRLGA